MLNDDAETGVRRMSRLVLRFAKRLLAPSREHARGSYNRALMRVRGGFHSGSHIVHYQGGERGNHVIKELLEDQNPAMIARYGDVELKAISSFQSGASPEELLARLKHLHRSAGFFPFEPSSSPDS